MIFKGSEALKVAGLASTDFTEPMKMCFKIKDKW